MLVLSISGAARAGDGDDISNVQGSINVSAGEHRGPVEGATPVKLVDPRLADACDVSQRDS